MTFISSIWGLVATPGKSAQSEDSDDYNSQSNVDATAVAPPSTTSAVATDEDDNDNTENGERLVGGDRDDSDVDGEGQTRSTRCDDDRGEEEVTAEGQDAFSTSGDGGAMDADDAARKQDPMSADHGSISLHQRIYEVLPDAGIRTPRIVMLGAQNCGKTKMVLSMVYTSLKDTPVPEEIGNFILRIFQVGKATVTRRPTVLEFQQTDHDDVQFTVSVPATNYSITFDPSNLQEMEDFLEAHHFSLLRADAFATLSELHLSVSGKHVHNMAFTDLPGLITFDNPLKESIEKLIFSYAEQENCTLVVMEGWNSNGLESSLIAPYIRKVHSRAVNPRHDIFDHSLLVFSKCDEALAQPVIQAIEDRSDLYPFRYQIGVTNRSLPADNIADDNINTWQDFVAYAQSRERHESAKKSQLPLLRTCGEVLELMETMSFDSLKASCRDGKQKLRRVMRKTLDRFHRTVAPSIDRYLTVQERATLTSQREINQALWRKLSVSILSQHQTTVERVILESVGSYIGGLSWTKFLDRQRRAEVRGSTSEILTLTQLTVFVEDVESLFRDFFVGAADGRGFDAVNNELHSQLEVLLNRREETNDASHLLVLHKLHRFPHITQHFRSRRQQFVDETNVEVKQAVDDYLSHFFRYLLPASLPSIHQDWPRAGGGKTVGDTGSTSPHVTSAAGALRLKASELHTVIDHLLREVAFVVAYQTTARWKKYLRNIECDRMDLYDEDASYLREKGALIDRLLNLNSQQALVQEIRDSANNNEDILRILDRTAAFVPEVDFDAVYDLMLSDNYSLATLKKLFEFSDVRDSVPASVQRVIAGGMSDTQESQYWEDWAGAAQSSASLSALQSVPEESVSEEPEAAGPVHSEQVEEQDESQTPQQQSSHEPSNAGDPSDRLSTAGGSEEAMSVSDEHHGSDAETDAEAEAEALLLDSVDVVAEDDLSDHLSEGTDSIDVESDNKANKRRKPGSRVSSNGHVRGSEPETDSLDLAAALATGSQGLDDSDAFASPGSKRRRNAVWMGSKSPRHEEHVVGSPSIGRATVPTSPIASMAVDLWSRSARVVSDSVERIASSMRRTDSHSGRAGSNGASDSRGGGDVVDAADVDDFGPLPGRGHVADPAGASSPVAKTESLRSPRASGTQSSIGSARRHLETAVVDLTD